MKVGFDMIDPELRRTGRLFKLLLNPRTPAAFARLQRLTAWAFLGRRPKDLRCDEVLIPRRDGGQLRLLVYRAPGAGSGKAPGILWAHGGGYAIGLPEQDVVSYARLIAASGCVIVAPDYRRSLEAPYPAALDDCYDALLWLKAHAARLGVRDDQLAVAGVSAGGGLAAAVSLYARDRGQVRIAFQLPLYPMIDDRMTTPSNTGNDAPVWNSAACRVAWDIYLAGLSGDAVPAYAAPSRAADFRGLPPTCTFVGELDPFRDETLEYVGRLRAAGVPVAFQLYQGAYHGFDGIVPKAAVSQRANRFMMAWFEAAVRQYFAPQM
jgi:acetyl esterase/lipase